MKTAVFNAFFNVIFAGFCLAAVFIGFDYYDSGFILSLSAKLNGGQTIYRDFDYVRPFGSPVFWDILLKPFFPVKNHLYIICRIFVLIQFLIIAYQISRIIFNADRWDRRMFLSIPFLVILHLNVFPLMPWHTIDGLFFLSFSLFYLNKKNILLAFLFSIIAATTKQSFFLIPFFILMISVVSYRKVNFRINLKLVLLSIVAITIFLIFNIPEALKFYRSVSLGSNKNILYDVGFGIYRDSFSYFFPFLISFVIAGFVSFKIKKTSFSPLFFGIFLLMCFLIPMYRYIADQFAHTSKYSAYGILSAANGLLPIALLLLILLFLKRRKTHFFPILTGFSALLIVWSSAISWGAGNIFLAFPFLLLTFKSEQFFSNKTLLLLLSCSIFSMRLLNPYLEKNIFEEKYVQLQKLPVYSGIFTSRSNAEYIKESQQIAAKYRNVIFLPGFPAASVMFEKTKNRMPWEMNVEYPNYKKDLSLLRSRNLYFVVDKKSFSYDKNSFYGSSFTDEVKARKTKIDSTGLFYIYK